MAGIFDVGGPQFGVQDTKLAVNNLNGSFGTAVDVPSIRRFQLSVRTVNATLEGDDVETDTHARLVSAQVQVEFGSVHLDVLKIITGVNIDETGMTPNLRRSLKFGAINFPYWGICGQALATQGGGDTHIFVPKCKIMEGFEVNMQYGQYVMPTLTCKAVLDTEYADNLIFDLIAHETAVDIAFPPT